MSKTVNEHIDTIAAQFRALSTSRRKTLHRQALALIATKPHLATASTFWRGLSANHVCALTA